MSEVHVSFTAETIGHLFGFAITNSLFTGVLTVILLVITIAILMSKLSAYKPSTMEIIVEMMYEALLGILNDIMGSAKAKIFFGFLVTFFLLIITWNIFGLLPIVPSLGIIEHGEVAHESSLGCVLLGGCVVTTEGVMEHPKFVPVLRAPTADLSSTLALALISVLATNAIGLAHYKLSFLKRYFDTRSFVDFLVGVLEFISEVGKLISFSFRLFGNIFAGEVLLAVITSLTFGIFTLPFLGLEMFVGFIQALVFFILTAVFISLAVESH